jgi:hypothetical protein
MLACAGLSPQQRRLLGSYAQIKEAQLYFPVGHYELRYSKDRKTIRINVVENATDTFWAMEQITGAGSARGTA